MNATSFVIIFSDCALYCKVHPSCVLPQRRPNTQGCLCSRHQVSLADGLPGRGSYWETDGTYRRAVQAFNVLWGADSACEYLGKLTVVPRAVVEVFPTPASVPGVPTSHYLRRMRLSALSTRTQGVRS